NEMDGFDVDVAREIAKRLGVKAEFVTPSWDVITAGNWAGRWDISVGSMAPTIDRAKVLKFPAVYYYTPAAAAVHKDSAITKPSELSGKIVGAGTATVYESYLKHDLAISNAPKFSYRIKPGKIHSLESTTVLLDDLRLGDGVRMDGLVGNYTSINAAIKNGYPIRLLEPVLFYEPLAVAIELGDRLFSRKIAAIVKNMHSDGTLSALSQKWYDVDYTATN
ncbi:MAG: transporter substrate-binding domain-containing protein, partial [Betaproteobacteria bacterium]|nr:transporter substrate-binding domain-containing protein [Betaproteobacteria bacterium]